jgi:adenylate cyclase
MRLSDAASSPDRLHDLDDLAGLDDLLEGLDGPLRAGRRRLLAELLERGYSADDLRAAHRLDRLPVLLVEEALQETASLTARDVAARCALDVDTVLSASRLLGIHVAGPDTRAFDDATCAALQTLQFAREYGMSQEALDEILLVLGRHMWQLAADIEVIVGNELGRPGDTEYEIAHRYADGARVLAPAAAPLIECAFAAHLRERMRDIFVTADEAASGALRAVTNVAVAFVDVVGFTGLGERVDAGHLKSVAASLVTVAEEVVDLPVRLVKTVGDAILLMCREPSALVDAVVRVNERARAHADLPPVHSGIAYGPAYIGGADVFGAPVNLASRLTDLALPGAVWADASVANETQRTFNWVPRGAHAVKGHDEPLALFELASAVPR